MSILLGVLTFWGIWCVSMALIAIFVGGLTYIIRGAK